MLAQPFHATSITTRHAEPLLTFVLAHVMQVNIKPPAGPLKPLVQKRAAYLFYGHHKEAAEVLEQPLVQTIDNELLEAIGSVVEDLSDVHSSFYKVGETHTGVPNQKMCMGIIATNVLNGGRWAIENGKAGRALAGF